MHELDLAREELRERATAVIDAAGGPTEPFGIYLFMPEDPMSELARSVESAVFDEFFGNSRELLDVEYGRYEPASFFICVLDHLRKLPAGAARITMASDLGLKTFTDIEAVWHQPVAEVLARTGGAWDLDRVWDAVTIAVSPEYRGKSTDGLISLAMIQAGTIGLRMCGARTWVTILDEIARANINAVVQDVWQAFPGVDPLRYLDSPSSVPCFVDTEAYEPGLAERDPTMHAIIYEGVGIEPVVRGPSWAPLLRRAGVDTAPDRIRR